MSNPPYDAKEVAELFWKFNKVPENARLRRESIQESMNILCSDAEVAFCVTTAAQLQTKTDAAAIDGGRSVREYLTGIGKSLAQDPARMLKFALFAGRVLGLVAALAAESRMANNEPKTNTPQPGNN
jgi:hypothetical protein